MRRRVPTKPKTDLLITACHMPDMARELRALQLVLRRKPPHAAELCDEAEAERNTTSTRSNASPSDEGEASTGTDTVSTSVAEKKGSTHEHTIRHPE